ncbi:MAG: T9SS type A sorting domain-containing protein, partial [Crocinitomix sp.]|nr:T9SS type A sorting domain-containing protein [Crocinitomix sp.]
IVVGAPNHGLDEFGGDFLANAGAAYLYSYIGGVWTQTQKLDAFDRTSSDQFGEAVSISSNKVMIGAFGNGLNELGLGSPVPQAGAAYIFDAGNNPVITAIHSNQEGQCDGQPITLSVEGVLYDAFEWEWFEGGCDGTSLGTGTEIIVSPLTTTTYCVRANGCFNYIEAEDCECINVIIKPGYWHQTTAAGLMETGNDLLTDSEGNVYITGTYSGFATFDGGEFSSVTVDHDPGLYTTTIKSYLAKYDNCGNLLWVTYSEGHTNEDYAHGIALDEMGNNLYIVGEFTDQITFRNGLGDFGFGSGTATRIRAGKNGYVAKVDKNNGKVMYIDAVWSTGSKSKLTAITINENNGRIFVAGQTYDDVGSEKVFIHKYAPSYITLNTAFWKAVSTTYNGAIINAMDFDESSPEAGENGALWVIGDFKSYFNIPKFFGSFLALTSSGTERDAFVLKYKDSYSSGTNPTGLFLKKGNVSPGAGNKMFGIDIAVEKETGNAFLTGTKKGVCDNAFDEPTHDLPSGSFVENGYFIGMRFDGAALSGGPLEELSYPFPLRNSSGKGVIVQDGVAYFIGTRGGDIYFDDGLMIPTTLNFYGLLGDQHLYIVAYNASTGAYSWSNGTTNPAPVLLANHQPMAITADGAGHLFITGYFQSEMGYIDGTPASGNLTSVSNANLFAMRVDIEGTGSEQLQKPSFVDLPLVGEVAIPSVNENDDLKASFDLSLVPNPTSNLTKIIITNFQENQLYEIMVFSSDGRIIYQGQLNQESTAFDLTNFSSGLYTVVVYSNNEVVFKKLLKINESK